MLSLVFVAVVLLFLFKILNVNNYPEKSLLYCANAQFLDAFLKRVPELSEPYVPTRLWGFSGHIQTIVQGVISRFQCPIVSGRRIFLKLTDGATLSYDLYQSRESHPEAEEADFTIAVCPGIGNNSESVYIRRVVFNAQKHGYRVAVLNHIGTLKKVPVTSPRLFQYGGTSDFGAMVKDVVRRYRYTKIVCVGFSMGGNMVTKYIGEPRVKPSNVIAGISVCQGYDANRVMNFLLEWKGFRRLYCYAMTENMKAIIRRWTPVLFSEDVKRRLGINERQAFNAGTLQELDDVYSRKLQGVSTVQEFYRRSSCSNHLKNIKIPMVFINALDDPIIPPPVLEIVRNAALTNDNLIYIEQKFGGHLGFYEGGFMWSNVLTWQDRIIVSISHALVAGHNTKYQKSEFEPEAEVSTLMDQKPSSRLEAEEKERMNRSQTPKIPFFETPSMSEVSGPDSDNEYCPPLISDEEDHSVNLNLNLGDSYSSLDDENDCSERSGSVIAGNIAGNIAAVAAAVWPTVGVVTDTDDVLEEEDSDNMIEQGDEEAFEPPVQPPNTPLPRSRKRATGLNIFPV